MKCALEMKMAVDEKLAREEIEKKLKEKKEFEKNMLEYLKNVSKLSDMIEEKLLEGNGRVELLFNRHPWKKDFYSFGKKDYSYLKTEPYWELRYKIENYFHLEHLVAFLENHCYEVKIETYSFVGYSSTGKSKRTVDCWKMIIKIPQ